MDMPVVAVMREGALDMRIVVVMIVQHAIGSMHLANVMPRSRWRHHLRRTRTWLRGGGRGPNHVTHTFAGTPIERSTHRQRQTRLSGGTNTWATSWMASCTCRP